MVISSSSSSHNHPSPSHFCVHCMTYLFVIKRLMKIKTRESFHLCVVLGRMHMAGWVGGTENGHDHPSPLVREGCGVRRYACLSFILLLVSCLFWRYCDNPVSEMRSEKEKKKKTCSIDSREEYCMLYSTPTHTEDQIQSIPPRSVHNASSVATNPLADIHGRAIVYIVPNDNALL